MAILDIRHASTKMIIGNRSFMRCPLPGNATIMKRGVSNATKISATQNKIPKIKKPDVIKETFVDPTTQTHRETVNNSSKITSSGRLAQVSNFNPSDEPLPKLVIIGSGWGSTYLLRNLKPYTYNVTLISSKSHFLYTPLLPEACSGTLEPNCIVEAARKLCKIDPFYFIEANVNDVDFGEKIINATSLAGELINIPYDFLVIGTGATVNTFGIPGVDKYAVPLKSIDDSVKIRRTVLSNFEKADICSSEEEKLRLLTFVVCGAGPTGVECIGELCDLINNDLINYYPKLVKEYVNLILLEGANRILLAMKPENSEKCLEHLKSINIDVRLNTLVSEITQDTITCKVKDQNTGEMSISKVPYGACIWSGGVGPSPLTKTLCGKLYPNKRTRALIVENDLSLRNQKDVFALGDCATFEGPTLLSLFEKVLGDSKSTSLPYATFSSTFKKVSHKLPYKNIPSSKVKELFQTFDADKSSKIEHAELEKLCNSMNMRFTTLAPTAQVASQQGAYLANKFNRTIPTFNGKSWQLNVRSNSPFKYNNLGVFAYIGGGKSILEFNNGYSLFGRFSFYIWKISYLCKQISLANAYSVVLQWFKSAYFGRNLSRL